MSIKALQDYTYVSKYARYNTNARRRETWAEAVDRVKEMHLRKFPHVADDIEWAFDLNKQKRVLGSQRALQFGGKPIEQKNARMYNCIASYCDRIRFFQETFWLLLCGCGTGFSVQKHHIAKLPNFLDVRTLGGPIEDKKYLIADSIEGWADALGVLIATYFPHGEFPEWEGCNVVFDYSLIRPAGSMLASSVGKAPGPEPLRRSLEIIRKLLNDRCKSYTKLRPIDAYDIVMHVSDAVLSGGVRRSATLCMFSLDDSEMMTAKTGNWFAENPQRARSNNSVTLIRNSTTKEQFTEAMKSVKEFGEPGFIWVDNLESLYNPCVEISLYAYDEDGNSGWQACVSYDTNLLTKCGNKKIGELVGKEVEIWNGKSWKKVVPFKTGEHRKLYRVYLSDGSYLDCTSNHKWLVKDRFHLKYEEVETKDLSKFSKYAISTPRPNIKWNGTVCEPAAYEIGFILGDGCCKRTDTNSGVRKSFATLFGHDHDLGLNCRVLQKLKIGEKYQVEATNVVFDEVDDKFCHKLKYSNGLPSEIFTWDRETCYKFIAGWLDSDGTKTGRGFRIYGEKSKIKDLQLLLTKLGFYSSINLMAKSGEKTNISFRKQDVWYVQVSDTKDLFSKRINLKQTVRKKSGKGNNQVIKKIVELKGRHDTYCVFEPELNQCVFNNVLTKQCNLCEINGKKIKHKEDFALAAKAAGIIGTLQASYTNFEYLGQTTKKIVEREALLGVSITGMMDNPDVIFDPAIQREMAKLVVDTNAWMSKKIGINPAARCTCLKPAGSTSCILGSASGIHPHHAKRYFRRVQGNFMEAPLQYFKKFNPAAVEKSVWSANKTDEVITFCVEIADGSKFKNQLGALTLLEYVKSTQQNWVVPGKREELCTQPWLSHNVSNTINVKPDEWDAITDFIYDNRQYFAGIALLPQSGDLDYPQAPFTTIYTPREIVQMYGDGSLFASGLIVDGLRAFDNNLWAACDAALGQGEPFAQSEEKDKCITLQELKKDFVRRARQFADRYFSGDIKQMTYCLKCVHNWKLWCDLNREYKDVDYSNLYEEQDDTKPMDTVACAGGVCQI